MREARLKRRLRVLARDFYARPGAQLPQACGSRAKTKAAYRFLSHPRASIPALLQSHYQATARGAAGEAVVLAVQDTTSLNYSAHPATEMLGLIGSQADGPVGMLVHSTSPGIPAQFFTFEMGCPPHDPPREKGLLSPAVSCAAEERETEGEERFRAREIRG